VPNGGRHTDLLVLAGLPSAAAELGLAEAVAAARLKLDAALPEGLRDAAARMRQWLHFDAPTWYDDPGTTTVMPAITSPLSPMPCGGNE
jgi:hypothetical protein